MYLPVCEPKLLAKMVHHDVGGIIVCFVLVLHEGVDNESYVLRGRQKQKHEGHGQERQGHLTLYPPLVSPVAKVRVVATRAQLEDDENVEHEENSKGNQRVDAYSHPRVGLLKLALTGEPHADAISVADENEARNVIDCVEDHAGRYGDFGPVDCVQA